MSHISAGQLSAFSQASMRTSSQDLLSIQPGWVVGLVGRPGHGLTRLGLSMLAPTARRALVAAVDVRGWLSPLAAWENGIEPEQLVMVRCPDRHQWLGVAAALLEGLPAIYAEVPTGIRDQDLRRLASLARARQARLVLRPLNGDLPDGVTHLRLQATYSTWGGVERGHGRLVNRRMELEASGKGAAGMVRRLIVEDDGSSLRVEEGNDGADSLRMVSRLAPVSGGSAIG